MKVIISNPTGASTSTTTGPLPITSNQELLTRTLREAAARAAQQQRSILASFSQPFEWCDAIHTFTGARQAELGECFFWEQPAEQTALVGLGAATTIATNGNTCFTASASAWRALMNDAVITSAPATLSTPNSGPVLFGGFAFDPLSPHTQLWADFPDGLLILPRFLLSYSANHVTLTINSMIQVSDNIEQTAQQLGACVRQLQTAIKQASETHFEEAPGQLSQHEMQPASAWMDMVANIVNSIQLGAFEKVVLARGIQVTLDDPAAAFDISLTLQRLRESYPNAYVFAIQRGERFFVGATPERLVQAQDGQIHTMALAGSERRGQTSAEDAQLGAELLRSEKNNNEHAIVVAMVRNALKNHCMNVHVSPVPQLLKLKNLQHLKTPIAGDLIPGRCILDVMADLHPTPAVGGFPRQSALDAIRDTEKLDRGWYAGPLGWIGASGHGEFAVALRSGLIDGGHATLFAGCGIVSNSEPQTEFAESCLKFQVMLRGLSGSNEGGMNVSNVNIKQDGEGSVSRGSGERISSVADIAMEEGYREGLANPTYIYVAAFVDELQRAGVRNVVICPGSRSTPLAMSFSAQPAIRTWMHVDERSAAYFGLGMAKQLRQPVALLCTSGTAAANFLPALVEAKLSHVPLLVLTADRPHELRDNGAPQSIDQNRLYGIYAKWFVELALPEATDAALRYIRTIAARATASARAIPAGPVHLNFPFREPLTPEPIPGQTLPPATQRDLVAWQGRPGNAPYIEVHESSLAVPTSMAIGNLMTMMRGARHGLIIVGPNDDPSLVEPLVRLARHLGYPILADPLSQLRCGNHDRTMVLSSYDAFLRIDSFIESVQPELLLRFGAMPTSKPLLLYLKRHSSCPLVIIDGHGGWEEPTQLASELFHANPVALCQELLTALDQQKPNEEMHPSVSRTWLSTWQNADKITLQTLQHIIQDFNELFEGRVFIELANLLPHGTTLYTGNSMPVRDLDTFFWSSEQRIRVLGNRGANGIDGIVSSALGASAAAAHTSQHEPTVLVLGDLSFFHDLNGLLAARLHQLNLTIVLINNDNKNIFSFLQHTAYPEHFEQLFGTPTGLDFRLVVEMYGGQFQKIASWEQFRKAVSRSLDTGGLHVIEVPTERTSNVTMHRQLWEALGKTLNKRGITARN